MQGVVAVQLQHFALLVHHHSCIRRDSTQLPALHRWWICRCCHWPEPGIPLL